MINSNVSNTAPEAFLRSLSHDHKEPIRSILRQIDKIQEQLSEVQVKKILEKLEKKEGMFAKSLDELKALIETLGDEIRHFREESKDQPISYDKITEFIIKIEKEYLNEYDEKLDSLNNDFKTVINQKLSREFTKVKDSSRRLKRRFQGTKTYAMARGKLSEIEFGLHNEVERVKGELEGLMENSDVKININGTAKIHADQIKIAQVFQNLIENSIRYARKSNPKKVIININMELCEENRLPDHVRTRFGIMENIRTDLQYVYITVQDNGRGIHEDDIPHIFGLYYRGANASGDEDEGGGTGTGLAIVQTIINAHRGFVWVTSEIDVGTIFYILLPSSQ